MSTLELHLGFDLTDIEITTKNRRVDKHGQPLLELTDFEVFVEQCLAAAEKFEHVFEDNTSVDYEDQPLVCQLIQAKRNEQAALDQIQKVQPKEIQQSFVLERLFEILGTQVHHRLRLNAKLNDFELCPFKDL